MHTATIHLARAMQHNRIFLWAPNTIRTPIPEDRKWWQQVHPPTLGYNSNVRSANRVPTCIKHLTSAHHGLLLALRITQTWLTSPRLGHSSDADP